MMFTFQFSAVDGGCPNACTGAQSTQIVPPAPAEPTASPATKLDPGTRSLTGVPQGVCPGVTLGLFNPDWNERSVFINGNGGDLILDFHCPTFEDEQRPNIEHGLGKHYRLHA